MSTTTLHTSAPAPALPARAIIRRFAWKEYRVLRGLWLAVAVLGVLIQLALNLLMPPQLDHAMLLFSVALGAAVLYAAGAAATSFSVEHEEETYSFLSGLPATWWPVFVGKLIVAAASAAALAAALAIAGWIICGYDTPGGRDTPAALGLFGVAILEALAWGTLFSLLTKRPLVAALLTLIVGATALHLAINITSSNQTASLNPNSYIEAIPLRLAIVALVFVASAAVARRWLTPSSPHRYTGAIASSPPRRTGEGTSTLWHRLSSLAAIIAAPIRSIVTRPMRGARRRMLARLLWQTWRESWLRLSLPIVVGLVLTTVAGLITFLTQLPGEAESLLIASTVFAIPTLFGAMAFSADQRRASYRFLAEHAAWPRYVWLARHTVWLGAVLLITVAAACAAAALVGVTFQTHLTDFVRDQEFGGGYFSAAEIIHDELRGLRTAIRVISLGGCGLLAAYGLGQFWSMLMRSEIIAAFTSFVFSIGLAAWVAVLVVWDLPGWLFLLSLVAGLMLATWLRAPAWIADRRTWRSWLAPALAIAAALSLIGAALPVVRLDQLPTSMPNVGNPEVAITNQLDWLREGDSPAARETAAMYFRAADLLDSWLNGGLLDRWDKPEYMEDGSAGFLGGIDEKKIPPNELAAYRNAKQELDKLQRNAEQAALKLATEASRRPSCRFDFHVDQAQLYQNHDWRRQLDLDSLSTFRQVEELLEFVMALYREPDRTLDRSITALRMSAHIRSGQPSVIFMSQLSRERQILDVIGQLAFRDEVTNEQLRETIQQLEAYFRAGYPTDEALLADHVIIDDVLHGNIYPLALSAGPNENAAYLAYLANGLSWELTRGLRALNVITLQNIHDANELSQRLANQRPYEYRNQQLRRWLQPVWIETDRSQNWLIQQPATATSYLTRFEYLARVYMNDLYHAICETEACRRASLIQLALAMYRRDHDEYPASLANLVSEYLAQLPLDPYTNQPFQFDPDGLEFALTRGYPHHDRVEPNTPVLWSVGPGNAQLQRAEQSSRVDGETDPLGEQPEVTETVFVLRSDDPGWWNEPAVVLLLPK